MIPTTPMSASAAHRGRDQPSGDAQALADVRRRALLLGEGPQLGAELELVLVEGEVHGLSARRSAQARGSPSTRSATTLRWISLVPA